uniref:Uncharacterized protein n=1 Tax=Caenorhabditis japonica TaxID=281687 RepID=A0A8R1ENE5_CAEJA
MLSVFVQGLPSTKQVEEYRNNFERIESWSTPDINKYLQENENYFNSGLDSRMIGQVQVDCTFDLATAYVTIITVDLSRFRLVERLIIILINIVISI